jgi:hypothetical protein
MLVSAGGGEGKNAAWPRGHGPKPLSPRRDCCRFPHDDSRGHTMD